MAHADESSFTIQCNFQGCRRTFRKFNTFKLHLSTFHSNLDDKFDDHTGNEDFELSGDHYNSDADENIHNNDQG